jgi:hypothetical protein
VRTSPLHQLRGGFQRQPDVPLLTEAQAAERAKYFDRGCANPVRAFQQMARRLGMPCKFAGRARLYDPRVVDAFMDREPWTRRHKPTPKQRVARRFAVVHNNGSVRENSDSGLGKGFPT